MKKLTILALTLALFMPVVASAQYDVEGCNLCTEMTGPGSFQGETQCTAVAPSGQGRQSCRQYYDSIYQVWYCENQGAYCYGAPIGPCPCQNQTQPCDCPSANLQNTVQAQQLAQQNEANERSLANLIGADAAARIAAGIIVSASTNRTPAMILADEQMRDKAIRAALGKALGREVGEGHELHIGRRAREPTTPAVAITSAEPALP